MPKQARRVPRAITHVRRCVEHRHRVGYGSVYQGRYKNG
jgi:hypothetical protein